MEERKNVSEAVAEGPGGVKVTRTPRTQALRVGMRKWLHEREISRQRTYAKDLLAFLIDERMVAQR